VHYLYRKIGSLFNHNSFYANIQSEDAASKTELNVELAGNG
jgi:hypothetical protein